MTGVQTCALPILVIKTLVLIAVLTACPAFATTIIVNNIDSATGLTNALWLNVNGTNEQLWFAGGLDVTVDGASRLVYCVDLLTTINVPGTYNTVTDFADTANLERVGWLMQNEWPTSSYTGATLQTQAAAFQLAIWDITNDSGNGFGTATTRAGIVSQSTDPSHPTIAAVLLAANKYETDSLNKTSAYGVVYHNTTMDGNNTIVQTLMGPPPNNPLTATPEPTAVILIFSGLAMIAVGRLRRPGQR